VTLPQRGCHLRPRGIHSRWRAKGGDPDEGFRQERGIRYGRRRDAGAAVHVREAGREARRHGPGGHDLW